MNLASIFNLLHLDQDMDFGTLTMIMIFCVFSYIRGTFIRDKERIGFLLL